MLGSNKNDRIAAALRSIAGAAPVVGSFLNELITELVPNQRIDRLEDFVVRLSARLGAHEDSLSEALSNPEKVALFEQGAAQAAKATSGERRERIARAVAEGLTSDEAVRIRAGKLLTLLDELTDDEIIMLMSYARRYQADQSFQAVNAHVLKPPRSHLKASRAEHDEATMFQLSTTRLERLGLLRSRIKRWKKGEVPEFNPDTGLPSVEGRELTQLGRLFLRTFEMLQDNEF